MWPLETVAEVTTLKLSTCCNFICSILWDTGSVVDAGSSPSSSFWCLKNDAIALSLVQRLQLFFTGIGPFSLLELRVACHSTKRPNEVPLYSTSCLVRHRAYRTVVWGCRRISPTVDMHMEFLPCTDILHINLPAPFASARR